MQPAPQLNDERLPLATWLANNADGVLEHHAGRHDAAREPLPEQVASFDAYARAALDGAWCSKRS
jgi:hypothetical protein